MKRRQFLTRPVAALVMGDGRVTPRIKIRCLATRHGKVRYADERGAADALRAQQAFVDAGRFKRRCVRYYACPGCGGYHLTGMPARRADEGARVA